MLLMRPATSGRSVTDSSERRLPTVVIVCGSEVVATLTASTVISPPPVAAPPLATPGAPTAGPARCAPSQ